MVDTQAFFFFFVVSGAGSSNNFDSITTSRAYSHTSAIIGNSLVVVGGGETFFRALDLHLWTWRERQEDPLKNLYGHSMCSLADGRLLVLGGVRLSVGYLDMKTPYIVAIVDTQINVAQQTTTGQVPANRLYFSQVRLGNKVVVWGGAESNGVADADLVYNTTLNTGKLVTGSRTRTFTDTHTHSNTQQHPNRTTQVANNTAEQLISDCHT